MPSDSFKHAVQRMLESRHFGGTATVTNYTDDGTTDEHGDPERTVESTSKGVPVVFRRADSIPPYSDLAVGRDQTVDVFAWAKDDEGIVEPDDDNRYGSTLTHTTTSKEYTVVEIWDEDNGMIRCGCREV